MTTQRSQPTDPNHAHDISLEGTFDFVNTYDMENTFDIEKGFAVVGCDARFRPRLVRRTWGDPLRGRGALA